MVPFDRKTGKGATVDACSKVLSDFFGFLAGEKKSTEGSPTESPPTDSVAVS